MPLNLSNLNLINRPTVQTQLSRTDQGTSVFSPFGDISMFVMRWSWSVIRGST